MGTTQEVVGTFGTIMFRAKTYTVTDFHFHMPSEHTFDGYRYDMEMHVVHKNNAPGVSGDYLI